MSRMEYNISGYNEYIQNEDLWIQMRFKTDSPEGVVLYAGSAQGDYLSLEIHRGRMFLSVNMGAFQNQVDELEKQKLTVGSLLDDGTWHSVEVRQNKREWNLTVDHVTMFNFTHGRLERINFDQSIQIGGVDTLSRPGIQTAKNFSGCLERVLVNSMDLIKDAKEKIAPARFTMYGSVGYSCAHSFARRPVSFPTAASYLNFEGPQGKTDGAEAQFQFRSYNEYGLLMQITFLKGEGRIILRFDRSGKIMLESRIRDPKMRDEKIVMQQTISSLEHPEGIFTDGVWHSLYLSWPQSGTGFFDIDEQRIFINAEFDMAEVTGYKIGGGVREEYGFLGCMRDIQVGSRLISDISTLANNPQENNGVLIDACEMQDRCNPDPCEHGSRCYQDWDTFFCDCTGTGYKGSVCHLSQYYLSCEAIRVWQPNRVGQVDTFIDLDGSGELPALRVTCDFRSDPSQPVEMYVHHDSEDWIYVSGFQEPGSYRRNVTYLADRDTLEELTRRSKMCRQEIAYRCLNSRLLATPPGGTTLHCRSSYGCWVGFDFQEHHYWGGSVPGMQRCACGVEGNCREQQSNANSGEDTCFCDIGSNKQVVDRGFLEYKEHLPVMMMKFGDTGVGQDQDKYGMHYLGPLMCTGDNIFDNAITFRKSDGTLRFEPIWHPRTSFDIRFEFRTTATEGVFVHMVSGPYFFMVRLYGGSTVEFRYDVGHGVYVVERMILNLNDNRWHVIQIERNRKEAYLQIDELNAASILEPQDITFRPIRWSNTLIVGADVNYDNGYVGCMRALLVNGHVLDLRGPVDRGEVTYGVTADCVGKCDANPCLNNAFCWERYDSYYCDCTLTPFRGYICGREMGVDLTDLQYVEFEFPRPINSVDETIQVAFSTWRRQGVLTQIVGRNPNGAIEYMTIKINNNGGIAIEFDVGFDYREISLDFPDVDLCNGQQHNLWVNRTENGRVVTIAVDDYPPKIHHFPNLASTADTIINNARYLYYGQNTSHPKGFIGCIFRAKFNEYYPFKRAFQDPKPDYVRLNPPNLRESRCGVEEIFHNPEPEEIRPTPPIAQEFIIITHKISPAAETAIIAACIAVAFIIFFVIAVIIAYFTICNRGEYSTREAADAEYAQNPDVWILRGDTGQPEVPKKREWVI